MNRVVPFALATLTLAGTGYSQNTTISPPKPVNCKWYKAPSNRRVGDHLGGTGVINYAGITSGTSNHYQCLDGSLKGQGPIIGITQVAFHQYGATCSPCNSNLQSYSSVTVTMAEFDYNKASNVFQANLTTNATAVMKNKKVSLPDWSKLPNSFVNSPYNLVFPFDTLYFYTGTNDLCTDIVATGGSFANSTPPRRTAYAAAVLENEPIYSCSLDLGNPNGMGCRASGRSNDFNLFAEVVVTTATNASLNLRLADGPANQGAVVGVSPVRATAQVPGWCQPVLQLPLLYLFGTLNSASQWKPKLATNGYTSALVGASIYLQAASTDPSGNKFLLTNIGHSVMPKQKMSTFKFRFQAVSVANSTSSSGAMTRRAPVIQYTHQ